MGYSIAPAQVVCLCASLPLCFCAFLDNSTGELVSIDLVVAVGVEEVNSRPIRRATVNASVLKWLIEQLRDAYFVAVASLSLSLSLLHIVDCYVPLNARSTIISTRTRLDPGNASLVYEQVGT